MSTTATSLVTQAGDWEVLVSSGRPRSEFAVDPYLIVRSIEAAAGRPLRARMTANLAGAAHLGLSALSIAESLTRWWHDQRIRIRWNGGGDTNALDRPVWVFDGHLDLAPADQSAQPGRSEESVEIIAHGLLNRIGHARKVSGQYWPNPTSFLESLSPDPQELWSDAPETPVLVGALPCSFNAQGRPNCYHLALKIDNDRLYRPNEAGVADSRGVPVFGASDGDLSRPWTYGKAIAYLLHHYLVEYELIDVDWFWNDTDPSAHGANIGIQKSLLLELTSSPPADETELFDWQMRQVVDPEHGYVEGLDWIDALAKIVAGARCQWHEQIVPYDAQDRPEDTPRTELRIWTPGSRTARQIMMVGRSSVGGTALSQRQVHRENWVESIRPIMREGSQVYTACTVRGARRLYELTLELQPGWTKHDDISPGDMPMDDAQRLASIKSCIEAADNELDAMAPTDGSDPDFTGSWASKHHPSGANFHANRHAGRLWWLKEFFLDNRPDSESWLQYSLDTWSIAGDGSARGHWPAPDGKERFRVDRPRSISDCVTTDDLGRRLHPLVEVTFTGSAGLIWESAASIGLSVIKPEGRGIAIRLDTGVSLREVYSNRVTTAAAQTYAAAANNWPSGYIWRSDESFVNVWAAICLGIFRVRITCCVDSDDVLEQTAELSDVPTDLRNEYVIERPESYQFRSRFFDGSNSVYLTSRPNTSSERNDWLAARNAARRWLDDHAAMVYTLPVLAPIIRFDLQVGDHVTQVVGLISDLAATSRGRRRYPSINGIVWDASGTTRWNIGRAGEI